MVIEPLEPRPNAQALSDLVDLLVDAVRGGASIGFLFPLPPNEAEAYWRRVWTEHGAGARLILVLRAEPGGPIIGSGQLAWENRPNGRHRAEVQKVLVHSRYRRQGLASRLMAELEAAARSRPVRLLFLDTSEGAGGATAFYRRCGYAYAGGIPDYALNPDGSPAANAIFYKRLD